MILLQYIGSLCPVVALEIQESMYFRIEISIVCLQVRTSYLPNEILWGYRFEHSCVSYDKQEAKYAVSITNLNKVRPDNTPR